MLVTRLPSRSVFTPSFASQLRGVYDDVYHNGVLALRYFRTIMISFLFQVAE